MAVLSDKNLKDYKSTLNELKTQVNGWTTYLNDAESTLNKSTGNIFKVQYAKGGKASKNIQTIIDTLQKLQKDLKTLINDANAYYTTAHNASKK